MTLTPHATWSREVDEDGPGILVKTTWSGAPLDRTDGHGFGLRASHQKLAERLCRAINDGVIFTDPVIKTDVFGKTYVSHNCRVLGRTLNADLNRLGY